MDATNHLPTYKGYTVDFNLKEFRKDSSTTSPEIIPFDSDEGINLLEEVSQNLKQSMKTSLQQEISNMILDVASSFDEVSNSDLQGISMATAMRIIALVKSRLPILAPYDYLSQEQTTIDVGSLVVCDYCNEDYSFSDKKGGLLIDNEAVCPNCVTDELKQQAESVCPSGISFKDWVLELRGGDNNVTVTAANTN
ncbi:MAG: hypothetical protein FD167_4549 [bacterium]|nr:MAG: hypothetical protein FD167_4549 [bacterium]